MNADIVARTLPMPELTRRVRSGIAFSTDDALARATGVRIAFTGREGGVSEGAYATLNLGTHVDDDLSCVSQNRQRALDAIGAPDAEIVPLNQVHGNHIVICNGVTTIGEVRDECARGADGIVVNECGIAPILCFADCASVIIVSAYGAFAIAHAGWRGAVAHIARRAAEALADEVARTSAVDANAVLAGCNAYIGPHIGPCCFQVGEDVRRRFADEFDAEAVQGDAVDLAFAIATDLTAAGMVPQRILNSDICTVCHADEYFSYRASQGVCGRHGAMAYRLCEETMMIGEQYRRVCEEVRAECDRAGRVPEDVTIVAVSKTTGLDGVYQAIVAGAVDFGENRPEQLEEKAEAFPEVRWHFIGNIQSRQIHRIVSHAYLIHSLFEERHATKIDEAAARIGKVQDVLLEVNVSGEESKSGLAPDEVPALVEFCSHLAHVRLRGLMTMAPQGDPSAAQSCFAGLRELRDEIRFSMPEDVAASFDILSMGMSEDWRVAIEEGATIVRIGRAIFSEDFA